MSAAPESAAPEAILVVVRLDERGNVVMSDNGRPLLLMTRKQALHLIERLAVALAGGGA